MAIVKSRKEGSKRYYGWRPQLPDRRDVRFHVPHRVLETLPAKVDLSPQMGQVLDQGSLGSCGPNAVDSLIMFDQQKQGLPVQSSSRLLIYYFTRQLMGTLGDDSGVDNRSMLKALNQFGFCKEELWPYEVSEFRRQPPEQAVTAALAGRVQSYASVEQDLDVMRGCLASGFPFLFGFTVYESFESQAVAESGQVPLPGAGEQVVGGHDVAICGYDDMEQHFLFKNSWNRWGFKGSGYGFFPYAYCVDPNLATDFWVINAIPTGAPAPTPTPTPTPTPLKVIFNLSFSRGVPRGGRVLFSAPVAIPVGKYDVVSHQQGSGLTAGGEGEDYPAEAQAPGGLADGEG